MVFRGILLLSGIGPAVAQNPECVKTQSCPGDRWRTFTTEWKTIRPSRIDNAIQAIDDGVEIKTTSNKSLCVDADPYTGGDQGARWPGALLSVRECNGMDSQIWRFNISTWHHGYPPHQRDDHGYVAGPAPIKFGANENLCIDAGTIFGGFRPFLGECNGTPQQGWESHYFHNIMELLIADNRANTPVYKSGMRLDYPHYDQRNMPINATGFGFGMGLFLLPESVGSTCTKHLIDSGITCDSSNIFHTQDWMLLDSDSPRFQGTSPAVSV